jgi:K+-sensing histidine kinase KdpD
MTKKIFKLNLNNNIKIKVSEKLFEILLKNLIDNAVKY